MEIKRGWWKTRIGGKMWVETVDCPNDLYPILGWNEEGFVFSWSLQGHIFRGMQSNDDLICPWDDGEQQTEKQDAVD